jgi:hypothetical protein
MIRLNCNLLAAIFVLAIFALPAPSQAQQEMTKDKLVGTWRLVSFKSTMGNQVSYPLGEHPGGFVAYTASRAWVLIMNLDRKVPAAAALSDAEAISEMETHVAYTGTYDADPTQTPDEIKIIIHVDSSSRQAIVATDRTLFDRVEGNKLTVKSPDVVVPATGLTSFFELEFIKAD